METKREVTKEKKQEFEQKYLEKLKQEYQQTLGTFSPDSRQEKERFITDAFQTLEKRLTGREGFEFADRQKTILKLKLARYFQSNESLDLNVLFDAIIESPKFINTDKGSLYRLFEIHEEKTLQKIAEIRKQRAEMGDREVANPYEALFATKSGKYYLARLLNMPHLAEESQYMNHCVGTSTSYINQMKRGEIEILSFRRVPKINPKTQKLEGDTPIITIEYNLKTKVIEQMKKSDDEYVKKDDSYFEDIIDALKQLRATRTDTGELRNFKRIASSELENIKVKDYCILTEQGEVFFQDFNPAGEQFAIKMGKMDIKPEMPREDSAKILQIVEGIKCNPEDIAFRKDEVTENTKVYIGNLTADFFSWLPDHIEHIYTTFPESKIRRQNVEIGGKSAKKLGAELKEKEKEIKVSDYGWDILKSKDFTTLKNSEQIKLIRLKVRDLGFKNGATTDEIYKKAKEFGLELCPAEVGPNLRLQYIDQPMGEYFWIAMKQIADRHGRPRVFTWDAA